MLAISRYPANPLKRDKTGHVARSSYPTGEAKLAISRYFPARLATLIMSILPVSSRPHLARTKYVHSDCLLAWAPHPTSIPIHTGIHIKA